MQGVWPMKKPQNILEAFKLAEGVITRKQAKKLLKRYKKLLKKQHDLLETPIQASMPEGEANDPGSRD